MNKKLIIIVLAGCILVLIVLGLYNYYVLQLENDQGNVSFSVEAIPLVTMEESYFSETGKEAWITSLGNDIFLTLLNTDYKNITLTKVLGEAGKYQNNEYGMTLTQDGSEIKVVKEGKVLFAGMTYEAKFFKNLTTHNWIWKETYNGTGPETQTDSVIVPIKKDAFTLSFSVDGKVHGTTDCNNFSTTYTLKQGKISFGPILSTKMFCEDSQEVEFIAAVTTGSIGYGEYEFSIENNRTIIFKRGEKYSTIEIKR